MVSEYRAYAYAASEPPDDTNPPSVPENLTGLYAGLAVTLTWDASTDDETVIGYGIFRDAELIASSGTNGYVDFVTAGTYEYAVFALDNDFHASAASDPFEITVASGIDPDPPTVPDNVSATFDSGDNTVTVTWDASTDTFGVAGYVVFRDGNPITLSFGPALSYVDHPVVDGTYDYTVEAFDGANNHSAQSDPDSAVVTIVDVTSPSTPTGVNATVDVDDIVTVTWTASTDNIAVVGYVIYRDGVAIDFADSSPWVATFPLAESGTFEYKVSAYDAANNHSALSTGDSVTVTITPGTDTTAPSVPTSVNATYSTTTHRTTVTWTASTDDTAVVGYVIYQDDNPIAFATASPWVSNPMTTPGTYVFKVSAYDAVPNHSALSTGDSIVATADTTDPTAPTNLTLQLSGNNVRLNWTASTDAVGVVGYIVYRDNNPIAYNFGTTPTYLDVAPTSGAHSYKVVAYDAANNQSTASTTKSITVLSGHTPPSNLATNDTTDVSAGMQQWIDGLNPNGPLTINFPTGATYHMEEMLNLKNKSRWTINWNGATFHKHNWNGGTALSQKYPYRNNGNMRLHNCTNMVLNGPRMTGAMVQWNNDGDPVHDGGDPTRSLNPDQTLWDAYQIELEAQHGIWISGGSNITINGGRISDVFGDFIAFERGNGDTIPDGITITGTLIGRRAGRQGLGVSSGRNLIFEGMDFDFNRRAWIDLEPYSTKDLVRNVKIRNNLAGLHILNWVSSGGQGDGPHDVLINNNVDDGGKCNVFCQSSNPDKSLRRRNWTVTNNRGNVKAAGKSVHTFTNVDGLTVTGNTQPLSSGMYYSLVRDCTDATVAPNSGVTGFSAVTGNGQARYEHWTPANVPPAYLVVGYSPSYTV